jgi:hypothetical protein
VRQHQESTELQYRLVDRAIGLGWPHERVQVIDESGAGGVDRHGFQKLIAEIGLGNAGLCRQGLAAWIRALGQRRHAEMARCDHSTTPAITVDPLPAAGDLTRLIAGIIIAIAMEPAHG